MEYRGEFDFFYGRESERLNFITIPKLLLKDPRFKRVSSEAKILYGCLLDRNSLSQKNGWLDGQNRVYVVYTIKEMQEDLCCATEKISRVLKELEAIGLIFRKRNGRGWRTIFMSWIICRFTGRRVGQNFDFRKTRISIIENLEFRIPKSRNFVYRNVIRLIRIKLIIVMVLRSAGRKMRSAIFSRMNMILRNWSVFCWRADIGGVRKKIFLCAGVSAFSFIGTGTVAGFVVLKWSVLVGTVWADLGQIVVYCITLNTA